MRDENDQATGRLNYVEVKANFSRHFCVFTEPIGQRETICRVRYHEPGNCRVIHHLSHSKQCKVLHTDCEADFYDCQDLHAGPNLKASAAIFFLNFCLNQIQFILLFSL